MQLVRRNYPRNARRTFSILKSWGVRVPSRRGKHQGGLKWDSLTGDYHTLLKEAQRRWWALSKSVSGDHEAHAALNADWAFIESQFARRGTVL